MTTSSQRTVALHLGLLGLSAVPVLAWWLAFGPPAAAHPPSAPPMALWRQWTVVLTAFGVKPIYLALSLGAIVWLWRRTAPDLAALRWGLIWFWVGEQSCTANYLFAGGQSDWLEYGHNWGMAVGFGFVAWAAMEGLDRRGIRFSTRHDRCAALGLCRRCWKHADAPCGLRQLFLFTIPGSALLALVPLTAGYKLTAYSSEVLGTRVCYGHTLASQVFEMRLCPTVVLVLCAVAWGVLWFRGARGVAASKALYAAALGPLGFGLMRTAFVAIFAEDLMWYETWEEWTELLFVVGVVFVLWTFRHGLLRDPAAAESVPPDAQG
jgi:hypothetical protein